MSEGSIGAVNAEADIAISKAPEKPVFNENFRPIEKGESFPGGMPLLLGQDAMKFGQQAESLYGGDGSGRGKWGEVFLSGEKATKIFAQPNNLLNAFDLEFIRKYGGIAGLPKFIGVVPNGYQMERFKGESLANLVNQEFNKDRDIKISNEEKWARILSREQAQELLNRVAEFHKGTGRLHGDLSHWDDIIVEPDGKIRLTDPEWEKIGDQTPHQELAGLYEFFTEKAGYKDLILPETISDDESRINLEKFKKEVVEKVDIEQSSFAKLGSEITGCKDQQIGVKIGDDGTVLVKKSSSEVKP
jgi:hypothetical protein